MADNKFTLRLGDDEIKELDKLKVDLGELSKSKIIKKVILN